MNVMKEKIYKDIELRSDEVQEVLGQIPPAIQRYGITVMLITVLVLLTGSAFFSYPDTIEVPFVLDSQSQKQPVKPQGFIILTSANIGKIRPGQRVLIRFETFPSQQYDFIEGRVESVSYIPESNGCYRALITLPQGLVSNNGTALPFIKLLRGTASVILQERSLLQKII